jgi:hypothetical protein
VLPCAESLPPNRYYEQAFQVDDTSVPRTVEPSSLCAISIRIVYLFPKISCPPNTWILDFFCLVFISTHAIHFMFLECETLYESSANSTL